MFITRIVRRSARRGRVVFNAACSHDFLRPCGRAVIEVTTRLARSIAGGARFDDRAASFKEAEGSITGRVRREVRSVLQAYAWNQGLLAAGACQCRPLSTLAVRETGITFSDTHCRVAKPRPGKPLGEGDDARSNERDRIISAPSGASTSRSRLGNQFLRGFCSECGIAIIDRSGV